LVLFFHRKGTSYSPNNFFVILGMYHFAMHPQMEPVFMDLMRQLRIDIKEQPGRLTRFEKTVKNNRDEHMKELYVSC